MMDAVPLASPRDDSLDMADFCGELFSSDDTPFTSADEELATEFVGEIGVDVPVAKFTDVEN